MRLVSPAKINLFLRVTGRRPDGYHDLVSLMCAIRLHDTVTLNFDTDRITVTCSEPGVPTDSSNTAFRAADGFLRHLGLQSGIGIAIDKQIPVAAGLGGGSSNAAAVLRGMNRHYGSPLSDDTLRSIALSIGADVPFFIDPTPSLATGVGEHLEPYPELTPHPIVLLSFGFGVATAEVYNNLNLGLTKRKETDTSSALTNRGFDARIHLRNDLEPVTAAMHPEVGTAREALLDTGAIGALMSGSGPTVFGVFPDPETAQRASKRLSESNDWRVISSAIWVDP